MTTRLSGSYCCNKSNLISLNDRNCSFIALNSLCDNYNNESYSNCIHTVSQQPLPNKRNNKQTHMIIKNIAKPARCN